MPAPPRWTRSYSDEEASSELNGGESLYSSDGNSRCGAENARDDISLLASHVLADLEAFFDHELLQDGDDDDDDNGDGASDTESAVRGGPWGGNAISLDELSVVLNASIQRHQPVIPYAQGVPREKTSAQQVLQTKRHQQRPQLPFAHFQHLLEQKTQLFRAKCQDARRETRLQAQQKRHRHPTSGWESERSRGSEDSSSVALDEEEDEMKREHDSFGDDDEEDEEEEPSDNEDDESVGDSVEPSATGGRPSKSVNASFGRTSSTCLLPITSTTTRDALTQATLMQDQGQQTSVSKTPASTKLSCSSTNSEQAVKKATREAKQKEDPESGEENIRLNGRAKWSLSFQSTNSPVLPAANGLSNSVVASSESSCSSEELNRLRRIHHQSDSRRNQTVTCRLREAESQTTPAKASVAQQQQPTRGHEKEQAIYRHSQKVLTPLALPHIKPQTWELDLSSFNARTKI